MSRLTEMTRKSQPKSSASKITILLQYILTYEEDRTYFEKWVGQSAEARVVDACLIPSELLSTVIGSL